MIQHLKMAMGKVMMRCTTLTLFLLISLGMIQNYAHATGCPTPETRACPAGCSRGEKIRPFQVCKQGSGVCCVYWIIRYKCRSDVNDCTQYYEQHWIFVYRKEGQCGRDCLLSPNPVSPSPMP